MWHLVQVLNNLEAFDKSFVFWDGSDQQLFLSAKPYQKEFDKIYEKVETCV